MMQATSCSVSFDNLIMEERCFVISRTKECRTCQWSFSKCPCPYMPYLPCWSCQNMTSNAIYSHSSRLSSSHPILVVRFPYLMHHFQVSLSPHGVPKSTVSRFQGNQLLADKYFKCLNTSLQRDICNLPEAITALVRVPQCVLDC